jgi:hypothetical protein
MSRKQNGKKPEPEPKAEPAKPAPKPLPQTLKVDREDTLELRYLREAGRRIEAEMARLNHENDAIQKETAAIRQRLRQKHDGIDVIGKYSVNFDSQTATLLPGVAQAQAQAQVPAPAIVEVDGEDKDVPEPVASA